MCYVMVTPFWSEHIVPAAVSRQRAKPVTYVLQGRRMVVVTSPVGLRCKQVALGQGEGCPTCPGGRRAQTMGSAGWESRWGYDVDGSIGGGLRAAEVQLLWCG